MATASAIEMIMNWKDHIVADPAVLVGKPVLKGTRLSVQLILERLADGWTETDVLRAYPRLTSEALQAVYAFAAEMVREEQYVAISKINA